MVQGKAIHLTKPVNLSSGIGTWLSAGQIGISTNATNMYICPLSLKMKLWHDMKVRLYMYECAINLIIHIYYSIVLTLLVHYPQATLSTNTKTFSQTLTNRIITCDH